MRILSTKVSNDKYDVSPDSLRSLGKDAIIVAASAKNRDERYRLLSHAQLLLDNAGVKNTSTGPHRTRLCHKHRSYTANEIAINLSTDPQQSAASLSGVQTCGSVWACPVCAAREALTKGREIAQALQWAKDNAYTPIMLTFTARHHSRMTLAGFKGKFKAAYRKMTQSREWRRVKKIIQLQHGIKAVEPTIGEHGWHYHYHLLFFVRNEVLRKLDESALDEWQTEAESTWLYHLDAVGLDGIGEYAFDCKIDSNAGEHYLAKLGLTVEDKTDTSYELSGSANKRGRGANVWTLLKRSLPGSPRASKYAALYVEYVTAMQGDNWINWSPGLKKLVGVDEGESDDDTSQEEIEMESWLVVPDDLWLFVAKQRAYGDVLSLAAQTRSKNAVNDLLRQLRHIHTKRPDPNVNSLRQRLSQAMRVHEMTRRALAEKYHPDDLYEFEKQRALIARLKKQLDMIGEI